MKDSRAAYSRFLSLVLRHDPGRIGLELDAGGWAVVSDLVSKARAHGVDLTIALVLEIVAESDKKRFALSPDGLRVRANQGHSVSIDLGLSPVRPPRTLYHGTSRRAVPAILRDGILPGARNHVHLSRTVHSARLVGARHGSPAVLVVEAGRLSAEGRQFFLSENLVWLTDRVPPDGVFPLRAYTNRDLYRDLLSLLELRRGPRLPLEAYLRSLISLLNDRATPEAPDIHELLFLLDRAFETRPADLEEAWRKTSEPADGESRTAVIDLLRRQVLDLRDLEKTGGIDDPLRYFGLDAPSGARWYNFEAATYLECACQGSFGGWEEGVGEARVRIEGEDETVDDDLLELGFLRWSDLAVFFSMGQYYE